MKKDNSYIIFHKSKLTGCIGWGQPISKELSYAWVNYGNKEFPKIKHEVIKLRYIKKPLSLYLRVFLMEEDI